MSADGMDSQHNDGQQNADANKQPESGDRSSDSTAEQNAFDQAREDTLPAFPAADTAGTTSPESERSAPTEPLNEFTANRPELREMLALKDAWEEQVQGKFVAGGDPGYLVPESGEQRGNLGYGDEFYTANTEVDVAAQQSKEFHDAPTEPELPGVNGAAAASSVEDISREPTQRLDDISQAPTGPLVENIADQPTTPLPGNPPNYSTQPMRTEGLSYDVRDGRFDGSIAPNEEDIPTQLSERNIPTDKLGAASSDDRPA